MSKTDENLMEAFAGESQANRKYLAFAKKADEDGYTQAAKLFRAAAAAETVHAHAHLKAAGGIGTTVENLKEAVDGETHEFTKMYPEMIDAAKSDDNSRAEKSFFFANEVEKVHAELYKKALDNLENLQETDFHVCSVCGFTTEGRKGQAAAQRFADGCLRKL